MAVMVYGSGGGSGDWVDITDSVTIGTGRQIKAPSSQSAAVEIENSATGAYVIITDIHPGDHYRITGWRDLRAAFLDVNGNPISGTYIKNHEQVALADDFGIAFIATLPNSSEYQCIYAPIEVIVPKLSTVKSIMVSHMGVYIGSTANDIIVEKWI